MWPGDTFRRVTHLFFSQSSEKYANKILLYYPQSWGVPTRITHALPHLPGAYWMFVRYSTTSAGNSLPKQICSLWMCFQFSWRSLLKNITMGSNVYDYWFVYKHVIMHLGDCQIPWKHMFIYGPLTGTPRLATSTIGCGFWNSSVSPPPYAHIWSYVARTHTPPHSLTNFHSLLSMHGHFCGTLMTINVLKE